MNPDWNIDIGPDKSYANAHDIDIDIDSERMRVEIEAGSGYGWSKNQESIPNEVLVALLRSVGYIVIPPDSGSAL